MSYEVTLVATVDLSVFLKRTTNPENHFRKSHLKVACLLVQDTAFNILQTRGA